MEWPFNDPPNVAVFTTKQILDRSEWIYYVTHDIEDGAWQFHPQGEGPTPESDAKILLLKEIVEMDSSILELADLPLGWCAWRDTKESPWKRKKNENQQ